MAVQRSEYVCLTGMTLLGSDQRSRFDRTTRVQRSKRAVLSGGLGGGEMKMTVEDLEVQQNC